MLRDLFGDTAKRGLFNGVEVMDILLGILSLVIVFCIFYFAPRKPKLLCAFKLKRKVLRAHGLQGFYWESMQVLQGDYYFQADRLSAEGWQYDCEIYIGA